MGGCLANHLVPGNQPQQVTTDEPFRLFGSEPYKQEASPAVSSSPTPEPSVALSDDELSIALFAEAYSTRLPNETFASYKARVKATGVMSKGFQWNTDNPTTGQLTIATIMPESIAITLNSGGAGTAYYVVMIATYDVTPSAVTPNDTYLEDHTISVSNIDGTIKVIGA